jgi:pyruvate-formate lyase
MSIQISIIAHRDAAATARFKAREARVDAKNDSLAGMYEYVAALHEAIADQPHRRDELAPELRDIAGRIADQEARSFRESVQRIGA